MFWYHKVRIQGKLKNGTVCCHLVVLLVRQSVQQKVEQKLHVIERWLAIRRMETTTAKTKTQWGRGNITALKDTIMPKITGSRKKKNRWIQNYFFQIFFYLLLLSANANISPNKWRLCRHSLGSFVYLLLYLFHLFILSLAGVVSRSGQQPIKPHKKTDAFRYGS